MALTNINCQCIGIPVPQPNPAQRYAYPLSAVNPATNANGPITFVAGTETFNFSANSIPSAVKPTGIMSAWVDTSAVPVGTNLIIQAGLQKFTIAGGTPGGYIIIAPTQSPFQLTITVSPNTAGPYSVVIILYNYNVYFTGQTSGAPLSGGTSGGTSGGSSGGSSGSSGGGSPGGGGGSKGGLL
jgi:uncharacterized membrane protein YgcG